MEKIVTRREDMNAENALVCDVKAENPRMTSFPSRRRLLGQAVAAASGALFMGEAGRAFATSQSTTRRGPLPAIGQTINLSLNAFGTTLVVNLPPPLPTLNFIGSTVVKVLTGGPDFVRLQMLEFTAESAHPRFGKITLRLPDIDVAPVGILKLGPGGLRETWLQTFEAIFERQGDTPGPFTYQTLEPAKWAANLTSYPPPPQGANPDGSPTGGALFKLQAPIRLGTIDGPRVKTEFAQLRGMNINVGQVLA
ncbi:hypothetical protein ACGFY9_06225 [Streptomyces sp. NPDC048504]|uniref:hypothetical protein n=1 Tax=Streptomyces sp. NPDC048504 TaxID=3365559 RepID=UPI00372226CE